MLGAIIGDTVGSAYEFHNTKDYNFTLFLGNSAYTDDSVMTMAVAYWLLQDKEHSYQGLEDIMVMLPRNIPVRWAAMAEGFTPGYSSQMGYITSMINTVLHLTSQRQVGIHTDPGATVRRCV